MITWYKDDKIGIFFDKMPNVLERYISPFDDRKTIENIKKKPFICKDDLQVQLENYKTQKSYIFNIPTEYTWDGASIPRLFWRVVGSKTDARFLIASLIHDYLCEHHEIVEYDRYFADKVFERLLYVSEVSSFNRWLMFHSVEFYQRGFGKW